MSELQPGYENWYKTASSTKTQTIPNLAEIGSPAANIS